MNQNLVEALDRMRLRGLKVDVERLGAFQSEMQADRDHVELELANQGVLKPGSRKTVNEATGCGMKQDAATLSRFKNPILDKVIEFRKAQREVSYSESFIQACSAGGRVHWTWKEADSGRLYTKDYNVQQISKSARACIIPDNRKFICLDYRQSEVRVAAILSGDEQMKKDIASGDIYSLLADIYFKAIKDSREAVKVMVLGIMYGMNPDGISMRLDIPKEAAAGILQSMMKRYSRLAEWIKEVHAKASSTHQVETMDGFVRKLDEPDRAVMLRQSINTSVQGSMADILKRAILVADQFHDADLACVVHDSLILDSKLDQPNVREGWAAPLEFVIKDVKMELKAKQGLTWGDVTDDKPAIVETRV